MKLFRNFDKTEIQQYIKNIEVYGFVKIENALEQDCLNKLYNLVQTHYENINKNKKVKYHGVPDRNKNDKIIYNLFNVDRLFISILCDPSLQTILMNKLNDPFYRFLPENVPN